jgi:hypothetical protein
MDQAEKALAKKVKAFYKSPKSDAGFTRDENLILERWKALNMLNEGVFLDITTLNSDHKEYIQSIGYPFKEFGEQEIKKDWYMHFRESKGITILRDAFTVIAFFVSLYLTVAKFLLK